MVRIVVLEGDLHPDIGYKFEKTFQSEGDAEIVEYYGKAYTVVDIATGERGRYFLLEPIGFDEAADSRDVYATLV